MKKVLIAVVALGLVSVPMLANAQLGKIQKSNFGKKGTLTIGATLAGGGLASVGGSLANFNNINVDDDNDDNDQSTFGIAPNIGYFFIDNLQVDLGIAYRSTSVGDADNSAFAIAPVVRYYLPVGALSKKGMLPYLGAGFAYISNTVSGAGPMGGDLTVTATDITIGAGLTQALGGNQGATISLGLEYHIGKSKPDVDGAEEQDFGGLALGVRFAAYLN